jgi:hypothetical protein
LLIKQHHVNLEIFYLALFQKARDSGVRQRNRLLLRRAAFLAE